MLCSLTSTGPKDGSAEFWVSQLNECLDVDDVAAAAHKLATAGFKRKHLGKFSREDLIAAGLSPGVSKDILDSQGTKGAVLLSALLYSLLSTLCSLS
jgi:hypothetical protein